MDFFPKIKGEVKLQTIILIGIVLAAGSFLLWIDTAESKIIGTFTLLLGILAVALAFADIMVAERYGKIIGHYDRLARTQQSSIKTMQNKTETAQQPESRKIGGEGMEYNLPSDETLTD